MCESFQIEDRDRGKGSLSYPFIKKERFRSLLISQHVYVHLGYAILNKMDKNNTIL